MPHGVQTALNSAFFPPFPSQKLTLEEFVAGYCMPDMQYGYISIDGQEIKVVVKDE